MLTIAIYFAIIGTIFFLILWRPAAALILTSNIFALKQWAQASSLFFLERPLLTNLLAGSLVLVAIFLQFVRDRVRRPLYPREAWLTAALLLYALLSILWAPDFETSMSIWYEQMRYIVTIVFLASITIQEPEDLKVAFSGMLVLGTILAALLMFAVKWDSRSIIIGRDAAFQEVGGNPLAVGQLGGTLVVLALLYRLKGHHLLLKALRCAAFLLGFALMIRSGSRGQIGGALFAAALFWAFMSQSRGYLKPLLVVISLGVLALIAKTWIDYFWKGHVGEARRFDASMIQGDIAGRVQNAITLLGHWIKSPFSIIFGLGSSASYKILGIYPHIVPIEVLGEEGLIGFALFCTTIVSNVVSGLRSLRMAAADREMRSLFACVAALWTYSFVLINKQGNLLGSTDFFLYSVLLGKLGQIVSERRSAERLVNEAPDVEQSAEGEGFLWNASSTR